MEREPEQLSKFVFKNNLYILFRLKRVQKLASHLEKNGEAVKLKRKAARRNLVNYGLLKFLNLARIRQSAKCIEIS